MRISRRSFLAGVAASSTLPGGLSGALSRRSRGDATLIDRGALVARHNPLLNKLDPFSSLSLGNGEFAFTSDITGLQTFPEAYQSMPLCTLSQWAWHTFPRPANLDSKVLKLTSYDSHGRQVGYATNPEGQTELFNWLRENPHRLNLGRIGLKLTLSNQTEAHVEDITAIEQTLDMWNGRLTSRFKLEGKSVSVLTAVHPELDMLAVSIESPLLAGGRIAVRFTFPYGSPNMEGADWKSTPKHQSTVIRQTGSMAALKRQLDDDQYFVDIAWQQSAGFRRSTAHEFLLEPKGGSQFQFAIAFSPSEPSQSLPPVGQTFQASADFWQRFWNEGGVVDLSGSRVSSSAGARAPDSPIALSHSDSVFGLDAAAGDRPDSQQLVWKVSPRNALVARLTFRLVESGPVSGEEPGLV